MGRGRVLCEGAECARQVVGRVSWRPWGMYLESQEARRWSHSRVGGRVGGIMPVGAGTGNYSWSLVCSPEEGGLA